MVQKHLFVWVFTFSLLVSVNAQDINQNTEVFAPFVSQLEGEIRNNLIRISWKDSLYIHGPVFIYRSETPFTSLAVLPPPAEVAYGVCSFLDEADRPGELHYFVVASDEWGRKYTLPLPNTNIMSIIVAPENVPGSIGRFNEDSFGSALHIVPIPGIEAMNFLIEEDKVIISFKGADNRKNLLLYRSLSPIMRQEDLVSALIIRQKVSSPVIDYPIPGIDYYYALIYEEELSGGIFSIRPGLNASGPVKIENTARRNSRDLPLPGLNLSEAMTGFSGLISDNSDTLEKHNDYSSIKETEVFPEDLVRGGAGEEFQLRSIVQGYFSLKEWNKAGEEFRRFLDLPRNSHNRARAQFYLGQVYYFEGKMREALFEFLSAQELYPENSHSWIQAVLEEFAR